MRAWAAAGRATTYHFLDLNLEDPADADDAWLGQSLSDSPQKSVTLLLGRWLLEGCYVHALGVEVA